MPESLDLPALYAPHHRLLIIWNTTACLQSQQHIDRFPEATQSSAGPETKGELERERVEAELEQDRRPPPREAPPYCRSAVSAVL
ncbi:hypothetical protein DPEC_G00201760 [Dallia pectoralis]|uniref:Uncharacterized protein n=1 Tax=Dallia pectoralis TaxID=75939 RepID=A0ACC2G9E3_DALPE|nr:hypothetical protein DPEC_G00201760 [Dallia pectoralis]